MPRHTIQIAQLENPDPQREPYRVVQFELWFAGKMTDQEIDLALPPQTPENYRLRQRRVARGKRGGAGAQQIRRVSALADLIENLKGYFPGG